MHDGHVYQGAKGGSILRAVGEMAARLKSF